MTAPAATQLAPISRSRHAGRKWRRYGDYSFARGRTAVPLVAPEVAAAAGSFPVVFVQDTHGWQPVALLGLEPGRNLLLDPGGQWLGDYVPALLRAYPFALARGPEGRSVLCVDEAALVEPGHKEGLPLVLEDGSLPEEVKKAGEFLAGLEAHRKATQAACAALARANCLRPLDAGGQGAAADPGVQQVNEAALAALPDADFLELKKAGALALAYAQLTSLHRLPWLARRKARHVQQQADLSLLERDGTLRFDVLS